MTGCLISRDGDLKVGFCLTIDPGEINDLMKKIINYLLYICKNVDSMSLEKDCLIKVLEYLKDYKMENPIHFLKVYMAFIN
jgi:hypothetical protein